MPQSAALAAAEDTAANCGPGVTPARVIQACAVAALVMVSMVVKVLDATITRVVAGFSPASVSEMSAPSTFETKWQRGPS